MDSERMDIDNTLILEMRSIVKFRSKDCNRNSVNYLFGIPGIRFAHFNLSCQLIETLLHFLCLVHNLVSELLLQKIQNQSFSLQCNLSLRYDMAINNHIEVALAFDLIRIPRLLPILFRYFLLQQFLLPMLNLLDHIFV